MLKEKSYISGKADSKSDKPSNIHQLTIQQIDQLNIIFIATTGRSASTLLGTMMMRNEQVIFTSEEIFPIILKQKYGKIKKWTEQDVKNYCDDFVLMSEGMLYPLFCGKDVLYELLIKFIEHLNYERVIRISYLAFGVGKDLSKITTIVDKQLRYYLFHHYLELFPHAKVVLLVRDPRDNMYSKYHRAMHKSITGNYCLYIHTWKDAFQTYIQVLKKYQNEYLVVNYEKLINDSQKTMQTISNFISIDYTEKYFDYPSVVQSFFNDIHHTKLKEHFIIIHKSLAQPLTPQKVNEWKKEMNNTTIAYIVNLTWAITRKVAEKFNYTQHDGFHKEKTKCRLTALKLKLTLIVSYLYFNMIPFSIKKIIKQIKYPHRKKALTTYDRFLNQSYL